TLVDSTRVPRQGLGGSNLQSAPPPAFCRITFGSMSQARLESPADIDPAAPSGAMPTSSSVAYSSWARRPERLTFSWPYASSQDRDVMSTLLVLQAMESACTEIFLPAGYLTLRPLSRRRSTRTSRLFTTGEWSAVSEASAKALPPDAVPADAAWLVRLRATMAVAMASPAFFMFLPRSLIQVRDCPPRADRIDFPRSAHPCRDSLVFKSITNRYLLDHRVSEPDAYLGYYTLTIFLRSTIVPRSCQPRGIVARCRKGGAGCGTCERDATHVTSPGGTREASPRQKDRGLVRLAVNAKAVDAAWRAELARRIR